jgi:hypothetical protein
MPDRDHADDHADGADDRPLVLDEVHDTFERFRLLGESDEAEADKLLEDLGGRGPTDHTIVVEMSADSPLAHPERFIEAHTLAMHSLEVLARNGTRPTTMPRIGPLAPVAKFAVQLVTTLIVRSHLGNVSNKMNDLYGRRLAWCRPDDAARMQLVRARLDLSRVQPGYKSRGATIPTFILGGAAASTAAGVLQRAASAVLSSRAAGIIGVLALFILFAGAAWAILRGAAVARRRIRLSVDRPLKALWETIGSCGNPPHDQARTFAIVGLILTTIGWLLVPLGALFIATAF